MKKVLLLWLSVAVLCQRAFAQWAAHLVVSPPSVEREPKAGAGYRFSAEAAHLARRVAVSTAADGRVTFAIEPAADPVETGKKYYLVVSKKRLPANALELRRVLQSSNALARQDGRAIMRKGKVEGFDEVRPLQPIDRNGTSVIEVVVDRDQALRSYLVWDHEGIYERGAMVMDGGIWLTYDIPAFVEASQKSKPPKSK